MLVNSKVISYKEDYILVKETTILKLLGIPVYRKVCGTNRKYTEKSDRISLVLEEF